MGTAGKQVLTSRAGAVRRRKAETEIQGTRSSSGRPRKDTLSLCRRLGGSHRKTPHAAPAREATASGKRRLPLEKGSSCRLWNGPPCNRPSIYCGLLDSRLHCAQLQNPHPRQAGGGGLRSARRIRSDACRQQPTEEEILHSDRPFLVVSSCSRAAPALKPLPPVAQAARTDTLREACRRFPGERFASIFLLDKIHPTRLPAPTLDPPPTLVEAEIFLNSGGIMAEATLLQFIQSGQLFISPERKSFIPTGERVAPGCRRLQFHPPVAATAAGGFLDAVKSVIVDASRHHLLYSTLEISETSSDLISHFLLVFNEGFCEFLAHKYAAIATTDSATVAADLICEGQMYIPLYRERICQQWTDTLRTLDPLYSPMNKNLSSVMKLIADDDSEPSSPSNLVSLMIKKGSPKAFPAASPGAVAAGPTLAVPLGGPLPLEVGSSRLPEVRNRPAATAAFPTAAGSEDPPIMVVPSFPKSRSLVLDIRSLQPNMDGIRMRVCVLEVLGSIVTTGPDSTRSDKARFIVGDETGTVTLLIEKKDKSDCIFYEGEVLELFECRSLLHVSAASKRTHLQVYVPDSRHVRHDQFHVSSKGFRSCLDVCAIPFAYRRDGSLWVQLVQKKETPAFRVYSCALKQLDDGPPLSLQEISALCSFMADDELAKISKKPLSSSNTTLLMQQGAECARHELSMRSRERRRVHNDFWHLPVGSFEYSCDQARMESVQEASIRILQEKTGASQAKNPFSTCDDESSLFSLSRAPEDPQMSVQSVQQNGKLTKSGWEQLSSESGLPSASCLSSVSSVLSSLSSPGGSSFVVRSASASSPSDSNLFEFDSNSAAADVSSRYAHASSGRKGSAAVGGGVQSTSGGPWPLRSGLRVDVFDMYAAAFLPSGPPSSSASSGPQKRDTGQVRWFSLFEAHQILCKHYPFHSRALELMVCRLSRVGINTTLGHGTPAMEDSSASASASFSSSSSSSAMSAAGGCRRSLAE